MNAMYSKWRKAHVLFNIQQENCVHIRIVYIYAHVYIVYNNKKIYRIFLLYNIYNIHIYVNLYVFCNTFTRR